MKHIKRYKLFEWVNSSIIETVKDLLLDLHDDEITVDVSLDTLGVGIGKMKDIICIKIGRMDGPSNNEKLFKPIYYKDQLESVKEFLESEGYRFYSFNWNAGYIDGGFTEAFKRSYFEYGSLSGDELFNKIYDVSFTKSPRATFRLNEKIEKTTKYIELYFK